MKAIKLKTERLVNPLGIDIKQPSLSWICQDGITQIAYAIEAVSDGRIIWNSGKVSTNKMQVTFGEVLESKQRVSWKVRLWDEADTVGEWSEEAYFEAGILDAAQFVAKWINPELESDPSIHMPASYLQTTFNAPLGSQARLYITCHGLYEAYLNGLRVGDFVLAPGSDTYNKKLTYQTYDVTELVKEGKNDVQVILGDGWYRSCSGVDGERNLFGEDIALYFQLEVDGVPVCISDEKWQATQDGPIRENDMQQGEIYDARKERLTSWHEVKVQDFQIAHFKGSNSVPVVEQERFAGKIMITPNGETVIDYGQNLAGYVEITVDAKEGQTLIMTHGESLDENGDFTIENFQDRKRHKEGEIKQRVELICRNGRNHYKSKFTIWGFRYAKIETDIDLATATFTSIAVYSNMEQTGSFQCSNEDVNQLVCNSIWSMKSNFCDMPTDCPTRERAAWTGDMGIFIETGLFFADCYPVVRKWLSECRLNQYDDGKLAIIAPPNNPMSQYAGMLASSVGWGDASIIVPYTLYKRFNDVRILEENYEMMQGWYGFLENRAKQINEQNTTEKENPYAMYTIDSGVDFGEWCEPGVSAMAAMSKPQYKVATAYFARSGRMLAEIAEVLGRSEDAAHYRDTAENAAKAFHFVGTDNGKIHSDRQAEYVRAISFDLLSEEEVKEAAAELNGKIIENDYHLNTGFLSTPSLCSVLAEYGYQETAYRLLLQDTMPGWLYEVKKGATSIWETWDGINEKGEVSASLNHYSYGAVCGWLFAGVCGIQVENDRIKIAPQPHQLLGYAKAVYQSSMGEIVSAWKYEQDQFFYEITVPANAKAEVCLPAGRHEFVTTGVHHF